MGVLEELNENVKANTAALHALTAALKTAGVAVPGELETTVSGPDHEEGSERADAEQGSQAQSGNQPAPSEIVWDEAKGKDKAGLYHDQRIHSKNGAKNADGTWRIRKGLENREEAVAQVKAEQEAYYVANGAGDDEDDQPAGASGGSMFETETHHAQGPAGDGQPEQQPPAQSNFEALFAECKSYMVKYVQAVNDNAKAAKDLQAAFESVGVSQISELTEDNVGKMHATLSQMVNQAAAGSEPGQPADPLAHMMG